MPGVNNTRLWDMVFVEEDRDCVGRIFVADYLREWKRGGTPVFYKMLAFSSNYDELDEKLCLVNKPSFLIEFERLGRKNSVLYQEIDYESFESRLGVISNHRIGGSEYTWRLCQLYLMRVWEHKIRWEFLSPNSNELYYKLIEQFQLPIAKDWVSEGRILYEKI